MRWRIPVWCMFGILVVVPLSADDRLIEQREKYKHAKYLRDIGRVSEFQELKAELKDYPLYVYLVYNEALRRLSSINPDEARSLKEQLANSALASQFQTRWLQAQAKHGRWSTYVEHFELPADVADQCTFVRALHRLGETERALSMVPDLWLVGVSQPKVCDPIFSIWIKNGNVTVDRAWLRLRLALHENSRQLARYLMRFFPSKERSRAQFFYDVHVNPKLVKNKSRFRNDGWGRATLIHGLLRFAQSDGLEAPTLWNRYRSEFDFEPEVLLKMDGDIAFWAARKGELVTKINPGFTASTIERIADTAISKGEWELAHDWLSVYPENERSRFKWRFWSAITERELGIEGATEKLEKLAQKRTYYGFLAAHELGVTPQINEYTPDGIDDHGPFSDDLRILRIFELYAVGDPASAKKEWRWLIPKLDKEQRAKVVQRISDIGWTTDAIFAASLGDVGDAIEARFPILYTDLFRQYSHVTNVQLPTLLAIARQESAFNPNARSIVGARGLMQLMLGTARRTASNIRASRPDSRALMDPHINIKIGSHHFAELLDEFEDNHVLAYAAYNAGSHRVNEWIEDASGMDTRIWVETIPFYETRNYVKNVLAFVQVYSHILDMSCPVLQSHELTIP